MRIGGTAQRLKSLRWFFLLRSHEEILVLEKQNPGIYMHCAVLYRFFVFCLFLSFISCCCLLLFVSCFRRPCPCRVLDCPWSLAPVPSSSLPFRSGAAPPAAAAVQQSRIGWRTEYPTRQEKHKAHTGGSGHHNSTRAATP